MSMRVIFATAVILGLAGSNLRVPYIPVSQALRICAGNDGGLSLATNHMADCTL